MKVLVTGASGLTGRAVATALLRRGDSVTVLQRRPAGLDTAEVLGDVADTELVLAAVRGQDAVLHLAAHGSPGIDWETAQRLNIDLTANVYDAAALKGAGRVVFASSNWVMAGHRFDQVRLTTDLPPRPLNPYGASKLFGERAGRVAWDLAASGVVDLVHGFGASVLGFARRRSGGRAPLVLNPQGLEEFGGSDPARARVKPWPVVSWHFTPPLCRITQPKPPPTARVS